MYLEKELAKRHAIGKRIALAELVATFTLTGTACDFGQTITSVPKNNNLDGDIEDTSLLVGEQPLTTESDIQNSQNILAQMGITNFNFFDYIIR